MFWDLAFELTKQKRYLVTPATSDVWTHTWSIKYRLITKLNALIETNLRDEFFKPN